jgi:hypothetical protein
MKDEHGIESYGISITTLEEVFLRVSEEKLEKQTLRKSAIAEAQDEKKEGGALELEK